MPTLIVDGISVTVEPGSTVLQACEAAGKEIPRFCYHERLTIAGNCRMCLVEQEKAPKPIASCAMPAADNMVIHTDTPMVKKARRGVMEFLLINHPLDCPICDQGGECDLQDQAMAYGFDRGRFLENKRAVKDKYLGPLVKTIMTRCIHCTRCVRFATEVAGVPELGALGRGEDMQITTYLEKAMTSELSGNVIDLCPVGALTSKPYAFAARSWELRKTESIDVHDALGSNIRIDARGREVMRILPRLNDDVNEEWLSDRSRFACDGLKRQRLDMPYVRRDGKLQPVQWGEAFAAIASKLKGVNGMKVGAIAGEMADVEAMYALKQLMLKLGSPNFDCRPQGLKIDLSHRGGYRFNSRIAGIDQADAILLIGVDPRREASVLNARIRKRWLTGKLTVAGIGVPPDQTYPFEALGDGANIIADIADGRHPFAAKLKDAKYPLLILGADALRQEDGAAIFAAAARIAQSCNLLQADWNGFNLLHSSAALTGGLDVGFVPQTGGKDTAHILQAAKDAAVDILFLLQSDAIDTTRLGRAFVIYVGSHGDAGAHRADVVLPAAAYTEKDATWVNVEGRVQHAYRAVPPPGDAREDWAIIRALSEVLGQTLPFNTLEELRARMIAAHPNLGHVDQVESIAWVPVSDGPAVGTRSLKPTSADFYLANPICRASATMAECSRIAAGGRERATGTHG